MCKYKYLFVGSKGFYYVVIYPLGYIFKKKGLIKQSKTSLPFADYQNTFISSICERVLQDFDITKIFDKFHRKNRREFSLRFPTFKIEYRE